MDLTGQNSLDHYLGGGIKEVDGWLSLTSAEFIAHLARFQTSIGIIGDTCEIGIHHGKLFLILANVTSGNERAVAVDIFSDQHKNVDQSGYGDREIFEGHLRKFAPHSAVDIVQESSLDLTNSDFAKRKFRMFSVDGGTHPRSRKTISLWHRPALSPAQSLCSTISSIHTGSG